MTRFLEWLWGLVAPRHKRIAEQSINTANEAIALLDEACAKLKETAATIDKQADDLAEARDLLRVYLRAILRLRSRVEALQRMAGEDAEEA